MHEQTKKVLITGGAGFIGSHVANELLSRGYRVRALDILSPQVHGASRARPVYLNREVELQIGDIRDRAALARALEGADAVLHFAALVGVGQSMYEVARYTSVNSLGTATLLEMLARRPVEKLIVASSMSVYGEGAYVTPSGRRCLNAVRSLDQLKRREWDPATESGEPMVPACTPEDKPPSLASIYALGKFDQEQMCLIAGRAFGIPTVALRFFNVYGPHQALSNPYTGVLAIFASRLLNYERPTIFEDGNQLRDFVSVHDVARACRLALESREAAGQAFNIGSGQQHTVRHVAEELARVLGRDIEPLITGKYRVGDIRHCFPDISLARKLLGYSPSVRLETGIEDFAEWLGEELAHDRFGEMHSELVSRGLVV
jgi:dTDP-L-rhamnose 4-epimerase